MDFHRELTRMNRSRYDFITMSPGQFLGEHHIPLVGQRPLALSISFDVATRTNLLWPYSSIVLYLRLRGESLKVAKSRPEPVGDKAAMLPAELVFTTRDLFSGVEALKSAGRSNVVK